MISGDYSVSKRIVRFRLRLDRGATRATLRAVAPRGRRRTPTQSRSRALVSAVVEATQDLLERGDSDRPSIRSIARRAGVGVGSVYEYFTDRDAILDAVVDRVTDENFVRFERVLKAHAEEPLERMIGAILDETFDLYLGSGALTRAAVRTMLRFGRLPHVTAVRDRFVDAVARHMGPRLPGLTHEELIASARAITDMTMGVVVSELYRGASPERGDAQRAAVERTVAAEIEHLRRLSAQRAQRVAT